MKKISPLFILIFIVTYTTSQAQIKKGSFRKLHLETGFNNLLSLNYSNSKNAYWNAPTTKTNRFYLGTSLNNLSSLYVGFRVLIGK